MSLLFQVFLKKKLIILNWGFGFKFYFLYYCVTIIFLEYRFDMIGWVISLSGPTLIGQKKIMCGFIFLIYLTIYF